MPQTKEIQRGRDTKGETYVEMEGRKDGERQKGENQRRKKILRTYRQRMKDEFGNDRGGKKGEDRRGGNRKVERGIH